VAVCGSATPNAEYKKKHYFFCSKRCLDAFRDRAERFRLNELWRAGAMFNKGTVRWAQA
jgi:YHS domain-containing protein